MNKPTFTFADNFKCAHEEPECLLNFTFVFGFWRDPTDEEQKANQEKYGEGRMIVSILEDGLLMPHRWMGMQICSIDPDYEGDVTWVCADCGKRKIVNGDKCYSLR